MFKFIILPSLFLSGIASGFILHFAGVPNAHNFFGKTEKLFTVAEQNAIKGHARNVDTKIRAAIDLKNHPYYNEYFRSIFGTRDKVQEQVASQLVKLQYIEIYVPLLKAEDDRMKPMTHQPNSYHAHLPYAMENKYPGHFVRIPPDYFQLPSDLDRERFLIHEAMHCLGASDFYRSIPRVPQGPTTSIVPLNDIGKIIFQQGQAAGLHMEVNPVYQIAIFPFFYNGHITTAMKLQPLDSGYPKNPGEVFNTWTLTMQGIENMDLCADAYAIFILMVSPR